MTEVEATVEIEAPLAEVWDVYFDPGRWRMWVDGFARVTASDGYPDRGGTLSWESTGAGRGRVSERVLAHEPRARHRIAYADPTSAGELETRFEMVPGAGSERRTRVAQTLDYALHDSGPLTALTDRLFIRTQMRRSLERSLADLRAELAGARARRRGAGGERGERGAGDDPIEPGGNGDPIEPGSDDPLEAGDGGDPAEAGDGGDPAEAGDGGIGAPPGPDPPAD